MLWPGYEGPKEQWRAELEHANKPALLGVIDNLVIHLDCVLGGNLNRESLLKTVRDWKKWGKWDAGHADYMRMQKDPDRYFEEKNRRRLAAKRAARRRKRGR